MKKFLLFISDLAVLFGSLLLTLYLRYGQGFSEKLEFHFIPFSSIFIVWLIIFYIANLYEPATLRNNIYFYSALLQAITISSVVSLTLFYLVPLFKIAPKTNFAIFAAIFTGLEFSVRFGFNRIFEKKFKKTVLIVGLNRQAFELAQFIKNNPQLGYNLKCVVDLTPNQPNDPLADREKEFDKFDIIQGLDVLEKQIKDNEIDTIFLNP